MARSGDTFRGGYVAGVLAIGAHPDDIELGCGGALLRHRDQGDRVSLLVMTTGERGPQDARSRIAEQQEAANMLGAALYWGGFEDCGVPANGAAVGVVQEAIALSDADFVYTHFPRDTHQDHRATATAVLAASRRCCRVLQFESPTSIAFQPSIYVDIDGYVQGKSSLVRAHLSQVVKNGLVDLEALEAQARYHGFHARIKNAEAFDSNRFVWDMASEPTLARDRALVLSESL